MTASGESAEFIPAAMLDRVVARGLDLMMSGIVFCAVAAPIMFAVALRGLSRMLEPGAEAGSGGIVAALALGAFAAVSWEPYRHARKGRSFGRSTVDIELRVAARPELRASNGQMWTRCVVSFAACGVLVVLSIAVASGVGFGLTPWRVVGLAAAAVGVGWLSALLRADRRGWHDLVAGTVCVSTFVPPCRTGL